jgi:hypothetical protein
MYLTKSRFKMAIECPTKLFYASQGKEVYFDKNQDSDFLQALADGGQQIGELAKFKYHDDPIGSMITVETLDHDDAVRQTEAMLARGGRVVIAEAALRHENYFIRVDVLICDEDNKTIDLIEVKSKSVTQEEIAKGFKNTKGEYIPGWLPYLYDVAYQTMVAQLAKPGYRIRPKLLLIDSAKVCDVDGLHQQFPISVSVDEKNRKRTVVKPKLGLLKSHIGNLDILCEVDGTGFVQDLLTKPINNPQHIPREQLQSVAIFSHWASDILQKKERVFHGVSKACKSCQFRAPVGSSVEKSGVHECWKDALSQGLIHGDSTEMNLSTPLSIDLWGGGAGARSFASEVLDKGIAFLKDIQATDIEATETSAPGKMTAFERRLAQIEAVENPQSSPHLNGNRLAEMDKWEWPLHMIDFETSAPAIPFFKGMRPYETLAFQFSHHIMEKDEAGVIHIRHENQWISTQAEKFPSIDFVRELKKALMPTGQLHGTVFRYHNHENTVLRKIRKMLVDDGAYAHEQDAAELVSFIDLITKSSGKDDVKDHVGDKAMVDLHRLVQEGYYSRHAGGSISLKFMLPAILKDATKMASIFEQSGAYGQQLKIKSLNFEDHVWLQAVKENNPYKTLPPVFGPEHSNLNEMLLRLLGDGDDDETSIADGGLAMTAYNYTQFNSLADSERKSIEAALLRYCELDTLAMVMLVMGLFELRGKPLDC